MDKREMLETRIYIKNKYLVKQLSKMFNRFKSKHVDKDAVWFVVERLYPNFFYNCNKLGLKCKIWRQRHNNLVNFILIAEEEN